MPRLPTQWNDDLKNIAVNNANVAEYAIPLFMSGANPVVTNGALSGNLCIGKGASSPYNNTSVMQVRTRLHRLGNWSADTKFAFQGNLWVDSGGSVALFVNLNSTPPVFVTGSTISNTTTAPTLVRSTPFTLTAGSFYGIQIYNTAGGNAYSSDFSLIVYQ